VRVAAGRDAASKESAVASVEGELNWRVGRTWYRVVGDLDGGGKLPVVILHGGPGAAHDYCQPIADLSRSGRGCVLYDQFGCGRSQHWPDAPSSFWTVDLFKEELRTLTQHLGIDDGYIVVGQSWGGMLAMEHALEHPAGLRAIVVCDSPASMRVWVSEANRLRQLLPAGVNETLLRNERAATTDSAEYKAAVRVFDDHYVCRVPRPACVEASFQQIDADPTVYHTMNGPSEFHVVGSLLDWDIRDKLPSISVPTLLVSGRYDEATPDMVSEIHGLIPGSAWALFEESSHMPHVEEPDAFLERVGVFLEGIDAAS
jgi:L-proline amide hydrolase